MTLYLKKILTPFFALAMLLIVIPAQAQAGPLTRHQDQFAHLLSAKTGLQLTVVRAWCLAEENGAAARKREKAGNNNWLNVGFFDGSTSHSKMSVHTSISQTLKTMRGFAGGKRILAAKHKSRETQIRAIAHSGWASTGYDNGNNLRRIIRHYHW